MTAYRDRREAGEYEPKKPKPKADKPAPKPKTEATTNSE